MSIGVAAGRARVELERNEGAIRELERLGVEEARAELERVDDGAPQLGERRRDRATSPEEDVETALDDGEDRIAVNERRREQDRAVGVDEAIEARQPPGDERLDDVVMKRRQEIGELGGRADAVRAARADPDVGLREHRIAVGRRERAHLFGVATSCERDRRHTRRSHDAGHARFASKRLDRARAEPRHVEILAEGGLGAHPVLAERVDRGEPSPAVDEQRRGAQHRLAIAEVGDGDVVVEARARRGRKRVGVQVADAEGAGARAPERDAVQRVVRRVKRRY
jgi:hypothetical protein